MKKICTKLLPTNDQNLGHSRYNGSFVKYDLFCILFISCKINFTLNLFILSIYLYIYLLIFVKYDLFYLFILHHTLLESCCVRWRKSCPFTDSDTILTNLFFICTSGFQIYSISSVCVTSMSKIHAKKFCSKTLCQWIIWRLINFQSIFHTKFSSPPCTFKEHKF